MKKPHNINNTIKSTKALKAHKPEHKAGKCEPNWKSIKFINVKKQHENNFTRLMKY